MKKPSRPVLVLGVLLLGVLCAWNLPRHIAEGAYPAATTPKPLLRQPVALVLPGDRRWLFAANQRSGTISVVDTSSLRVVTEVAVGRCLADLVTTRDGSLLLAADEDAGELIVLRRHDSALEITHRVKVGPMPVSIQVSRDGAQCTVASLWTRHLTTIALGASPHIVQTVTLPFAPRKQLLSNDTKLVVADAFGGRLAVVDLDRGVLESVRALPAHNVRGLALSADGRYLLLTQQTLNPLARAHFDDIHWGNLLTNYVQSLRLTAVLDPKADLLQGSSLAPLGDAGHGTGDPAGLATCDGRMAIALAGVNEVAVGRAQGDDWQYIAVGRRPTALTPSQDGRRLYVANTFSDSISVLDLSANKSIAEITLGDRPELKPSDRGEMLFYDARLSHDGWLSCHSCHSDGHSSGRLADTLGDGTYGTPKRILSLRGVGETAPWAWNGSIMQLETQVQKSIETTMHGPKPSLEQVRDLTAFLKTLPPPPPLVSTAAREEQVHRGQALFTKYACAQCHIPPLYTSSKAYDVGLSDEAGQKSFNPPSLRGVSQGGPYFHDGRAVALAEVFTRYRHQLKSELTKQELEDLLAFLGTL
jgi:YVTN family beta-propeller protein